MLHTFCNLIFGPSDMQIAFGCIKVLRWGHVLERIHSLLRRLVRFRLLLSFHLSKAVVAEQRRVLVQWKSPRSQHLL